MQEQMQAGNDGDWVALLGVKGGPAIYPGGQLPTSHLLRLAGRTIVIDCGSGVAAGIARQGVALKRLDDIFITHLHSDHYLDLGPLLHTAWTAGLAHRVRVFAPAGTDIYWRHFLAAMAFDIETRIADEGRPDLAGLVDLVTLYEGLVIEEGGLTVSAMHNVHPPIVDSFALRFETEATSVVFSGDTAFHPPLADFARGARLLIHEAMYVEGIERLIARLGHTDERLRRHMFASHTPVEDAGRIAAMAGVEALAINHLIPVDDPLITREDWERAARKHWAGPLHVGHDGLRISLAGS